MKVSLKGLSKSILLHEKCFRRWSWKGQQRCEFRKVRYDQSVNEKSHRQEAQEGVSCFLKKL